MRDRCCTNADFILAESEETPSQLDTSTLWEFCLLIARTATHSTCQHSTMLLEKDSACAFGHRWAVVSKHGSDILLNHSCSSLKGSWEVTL